MFSLLSVHLSRWSQLLGQKALWFLVQGVTYPASSEALDMTKLNQQNSFFFFSFTLWLRMLQYLYFRIYVAVVSKVVSLVNQKSNNNTDCKAKGSESI